MNDDKMKLCAQIVLDLANEEGWKKGDNARQLADLALEAEAELAALRASNAELLEALEEAHETMQAIRDNVPESAYYAILTLLDGKWTATWDKIKAAIAKAKG